MAKMAYFEHAQVITTLMHIVRDPNNTLQPGPLLEREIDSYRPEIDREQVTALLRSRSEPVCELLSVVGMDFVTVRKPRGSETRGERVDRAVGDLNRWDNSMDE